MTQRLYLKAALQTVTHSASGKIQNHTAEIQRLTGEMIDARKVANKIEEPRAKAIAYHDTVAVCFDEIRRHIDKLEEIVDDQIWPLPKYRELLFLR